VAVRPLRVVWVRVGGGGVAGFGRLRAPTAQRTGFGLTAEAFKVVVLPL